MDKIFGLKRMHVGPLYFDENNMTVESRRKVVPQMSQICNLPSQPSAMIDFVCQVYFGANSTFDTPGIIECIGSVKNCNEWYLSESGV